MCKAKLLNEFESTWTEMQAMSVFNRTLISENFGNL